MPQRLFLKFAITCILLTACSGADVAVDDRAQSLVLPGDTPSAVPIIRGRDGRVDISLTLPKDGRIGGRTYKGFRLYRRKQNFERAFNQPDVVLVEDLKGKSSCTVEGLQNGELHIFHLKAYDSDDKEFWETELLGLPGTPAAGKPRTPQDCYGIAGDGRVALFWGKNLESDLRGYEVFRKGADEAVFRRVARVPKFFQIKPKTTSGPGNGSSLIQGISPPGYLDTQVLNGASYTYQIRAVDEDGLTSDVTEPVTVVPKPYSPPTPDEVLLIVDEAFDGSEEVARYYAKKRKIPTTNIFRYWHNPKVYATDYVREIQQPLRQFLLKNGLAGTIRVLVPCYGVPIGAAGRALDSKLADLFDRYTFGSTMGAPNPYFNSRRHFDGTTGTYLVTRLDGPTVAIAKSLIDKAMQAETSVTARSGTAYFGGRGRKSVGDRSINQAAEIGRKMGVTVVARTGEFGEHELGSDAYWYFAWYHGYRDPVREEWPVGAVGAHLISNSFSSIRRTGGAARCWVQGLLEKGITATFGAVIEPYEQGYTRPDIFFEQFWSGDYTFAESFAMATPTINWAMSAVGDPLYRLKK